MPYGGVSANTIQLGRESTAGTAVAATAVWRGPAADLEDARTRQFVEEQVGLIVPTGRVYDSFLLARLALPQTELTFEQVLHILEGGVKAVTPTGNSPVYTYTYALPVTTSLNTLKTYTIETGNTVGGDARRAEYCFVEEFEFAGQAREAWKMSANWVGRQVAVNALTSALSLPTVEEALFPKTSLYIDASGGAIGSTKKSGVLTKASVRVRTGWQIVPVGDGNLYYAAIKYTLPEVRWSITMELESGGILAAERAAQAAKSVRLVRLDCAGSDVNHNFQVSGAVIWEKVGGYENEDGDTVATLEGVGRYSSADSLFWQCVVKCGLAAVP